MAGVAATALIVAPAVAGVNAVVVALLLGVVLVNAGGDRLELDDHVLAFLSGPTLKVAVVLLGAGIDLSSVAGVGVRAVAITAGAVLLAMTVAWFLGRRLGLSDRAAVLIGVGTAICGASAIAAVAPVLRATRSQIGVALATVFSFNAVALLSYPLVGTTLGLTPVEFGAWAGIGVHDTASAVATGFAFGPVAGEVATLVKLGRTLFLLPLLAVTVLVVRRRGDDGARGTNLVGAVPWFVVGFAALAAANTAGLPAGLGGLTSEAGRLLVLIVVAAVGLTVRLRQVVSIGRPLLLTGVAASLAVGGFALAAILTLGAG